MAKDADLPRVTYTNIAADFTPLHAMLDRAIPEFRRGLGKAWPNVIGGKPDEEGRRYEAATPIDRGLTLGRFVEATPDAVGRAIAAARAAFPAWSQTPWQERVAILQRVSALLDRRKYEIGIACLLEVGKSRLEAIGEVEEAVDIIPYYAGEMARNEGYVHALARAMPHEATESVLRPVGVFGVIGPFNYPVAVPMNMMIGALITGNTIVYKPSPFAGLTAAMLFAVFAEAGLPPGVANLVCGGDATGRALVEGAIDGIAFTGSYATGTAIWRHFATGPYARPVIAEMGGKNPTYVTRSADLDAAAEGLMRSAFGLQGEKCSSCEVAYIERSVYGEVAALLREKTARLKVGNPEERDVFVGPLIDEAAGRRFEAMVEEARGAGATIHGGARREAPPLDRGFYAEPTIIEGLPADHRLIREELFLPVIALQAFDDLGEALRRGNAVPYGLTAGFYGKDEKELERFLAEAAAGVLYANRRSGATTGAWPGIQTFGGWKGSGASGKNGFGPYYLPLFMREQSRTVIRAA